MLVAGHETPGRVNDAAVGEDMGPAARKHPNGQAATSAPMPTARAAHTIAIRGRMTRQSRATR
jgi:hypothetical protein